MGRTIGTLVAIAILALGCTVPASSSPTPSPLPSGAPLAELRYHLLDTLGGQLWFCDPALSTHQSWDLAAA